MARAPKRKKPPAKPVKWYVGLVTNVLAGNKLTATVNRAAVTMPYTPGFSPIVGHTVRVALSNGRWSAVGPVSSGDVTIPAGDDAPDPPTSGVHGPIRPIYAGTWRGNSWKPGPLVQGDLYGAAQVGCAFYGTGAAVRLPGSNIDARLIIRGVDERSLGTVSIRPVLEHARPLGAPTLGAELLSVALAGRQPVEVHLTDVPEFAAGTWGGIAINDPTDPANVAVGTDLDSLTFYLDWS